MSDARAVSSPPPSTSSASQREIGVPADLLAVRQGASQAAWRVGVALAARWGSRLSACRLQATPERHEPSVLGLLQRPDERDRMRVSPQSQSDAHVFARLAHAAGAGWAQWLTCSGDLADTLHRLGAWHDLVIVDRDMAGADDPFEHFGQTLLGCRMPCLLLPAEGEECDGRFSRVAIGWNGSIEATRAIHAALPFLRAAEHVTLLDGSHAPSEDETERSPGFDPCGYLARHGIVTRRRPLRTTASHAGEALLEATARDSADLLVMGGYSHSPVRERVLGGATRHVLGHAPLAVLMRH